MGALLLAALFFGSAACDAAPDPSIDAGLFDAGVVDAGVDGGADCGDAGTGEPLEVRAVIGIEGGLVALGNGAELEVPPYALGSETELTLRSVPEPAAPFSGEHYTLSPETVTFARPAILRLPAAMCAPSAEGISWAGPEGAEYLGGTAEGMRVSVPVVRSGRFASTQGSELRTVMGVAVETQIIAGTVELTPIPQVAMPGISSEPNGGPPLTPEWGPGGTFRIRNVPRGRYLLEMGAFLPYPMWLSTDAAVIDLGRDRKGRVIGDRAGPNTFLSLDLEGLEPWSAGHLLELYSSSGFYARRATEGSGVTNAPQPGATSTEDLTMKLAGPGTVEPLPDASHGDWLMISQQVRRQASDGTGFMVTTQDAWVPSITLTSEATTHTRATLTPRLMDREFPLRVATTQHVSAMEGATPMGYAKEGPHTSLDVAATDGPPLLGLESWTDPQLLWVHDPPLHTDFEGGLLAYGLPSAPGAWRPYLRFASILDLSYPEPVILWFISTVPVDERASVPLRPVLSAPRALMVNGEDAQIPRTLIPDRPMLSWDAPILGTPSAYSVLVYSLSGGRAHLEDVIVTEQRSARLPRALRAGVRYAFVIEAKQITGMRPDAPFRSSLPAHITSAATAVIRLSP